MNSFENQSASELLTLLMDGELPQEMETELYASLSQSGELQQEMREMISVRDAVRRDSEAFTPPIEAQKNVFATLGIETTTMPNPAAPVAGSLLNNILRKVWAPIGAAALATGITIGFMSSIDDQNIADNEIEANVPIVKSGVEQIVETETSDINSVSDLDEAIFAASTGSNSTGNNHSSTQLFVDNDEDYQDILLINNDEASTESEVKEKISSPNIILASSSPEFNFSNKLNRPGINTSIINSGLNSPLFTEDMNMFIPKNKIMLSSGFSSQDQSKDFMVSYFVKSNDWLQVAVQVGVQELKSNGLTIENPVDQLGKAGVYTQLLNTDWSLIGISPFVNANFGLTSGGTYLGAGLGLNYSISSAFDLSISYNYQKLNIDLKSYSNQEKGFILGGLSYKF